MGLYREVLYSNAPILKFHNNFFGEMEQYQDLSAPQPHEIAEEQRRKLMQFQVQAFKNNTKTELINKFLQFNGILATSTEQYDQIVYDKMNDLFSQINQLISKGYMSKNIRTDLVSNKQLEQQIVTKLQILGHTLNTLRSQANMTISSSYIDQLDQVIKELPGGDIDLVLRTLYHLKGDILEEVGVEWFNKRIPTDLNVKAFSTGAIRGKKGQLIQDLLVVDMDNIDLLNIEIGFKLGDVNQTMTLKEFFNKVENYSGSEQIVINSEGEKLLQDISLLGIQAKSGINQLPWNTGTKNTWVSIQGDGGQLDQYCLFLDHLEKLRNSEEWNGEKNIKKESPAYTAMANYELSKSLSKVLHLSQSANQYVLTPNGFMPFVSRILELYEKQGGGEKNYYFSFGGRIQLTKENDIIVKARPVVLGV